ncbi:hypothetical protein GALL_446940 [mine drainage metagenome]|jgi:hypothetical protein|uniref:Uncharacterized protein n=1 Tax=mine drainage metagenome TaxID=410659 RepID=A0A1J5PQ91_9ZZZZ
MTENQDLIKKICEKSYKPLQEASIAGSEQYRSYTIDCDKLEDFDDVNIYIDKQYKEMFDELISFACPIVYWFEIISPVSTEAIVKAISKYKGRTIRKAIPAIHKNPNHGTTVLYVGKVMKGFAGRVVTHLGYYKVTRTQGLQLFHWSKELKLILKLHVYSFKKELAPMMIVIERGVADELKPLLGKHR